MSSKFVLTCPVNIEELFPRIKSHTINEDFFKLTLQRQSTLRKALKWDEWKVVIGELNDQLKAHPEFALNPDFEAPLVFLGFLKPKH